MKVSEPPVIVEHIFYQPAAKVWEAITNRDEMVQWFFDNIPGFKPEVGFKTEFNVQAPSRDFLHLWEVTEVVPLQKLVTNWQYKGMPGNSFVTMELNEVDSKTHFKLTTEVVEDFDDSIPEFKRESCVAGWNYFITQQLANYLA